ncbi:MAG: hypothetical protein WCH39_10270, partial [Schlesneria sp.]
MKITRDQWWRIVATALPTIIGLALYCSHATKPPNEIEIVIPLTPPRVEHQGWVEPPPTLKAWAAEQPQFRITGANGDAVNQD